ncbi:MAG: DUF692 family protein [Nitrospira sp.]|nr:DUF692 family protein [Nitrospira sp.]MBH0185450.1 DUF692 family protein [Nitrospira sp.]
MAVGKRNRVAIVSQVEKEFSRRLEQVPAHGMGLSVDIYSPNLTSLLGALHQCQAKPAYLEIFRAAPAALAAVRKQVQSSLLTYHGEGLWLTQPETLDDPSFVQEVCEVAGHLQTLDSAWLNHECATKYIAGYSYGTYLPPLYTESSASVVAENVLLIQDLLDRHCRLKNGASPLVLLEMPPLTYFVAGTLAIPTFFRLVTQWTSCGLVLDVGHLWTVFRYSGAWRTSTLVQFVDDFLRQFPMERIVEIHVAGLAVHESSMAGYLPLLDREESNVLPAWTDAHAAPVPPVLFEILDRVLSHPRLTGLRGLALEVDTKPIPLIVEEFVRFSARYGSVLAPMKKEAGGTQESGHERLSRAPLSGSAKHELEAAYERYARVAAGRSEPEGPEWSLPTACVDELGTYRSMYLPYEILSWGGQVDAMFPQSCRRLEEQGVPLSKFVSFWFRRPRMLSGSYDFFLVKIDRFVEFVLEEAPDLAAVVEQEAHELRRAYDHANEPPVQVVGERT